jgi:hypothetical protein
VLHKEETMHRLKSLAQLVVTIAFVAVMAAGIAAAAERRHASAGECGEYKYWHNGHCVDAREKPGKDWTGSVF